MKDRYQQYLSEFISINTVSTQSNISIIEYIESILRPIGYDLQRVPSPDGDKSALIAIAGDPARPGVIVSGHTDVVPADGQPWSSDPFTPRVANGRIYGRGATDMKGFLAVMLAHADSLSRAAGPTPVILAFSYDEELGCRGAPVLVDQIIRLPALPGLCIVGEPTRMRVANAHKGKTANRITFTGLTGHSAMPHKAVSALWSGASLALAIRAAAERLAVRGGGDGFDPPFSTLHVGSLKSGGALNLVPDVAVLEFELRNLPDLDVQAELAPILEMARSEGRALADQADVGGVRIEQISAYPGLFTDPRSPATRAVRSLAADTGPLQSLSFGTEAGIFSAAGIPTLVCGPGDMDRAHKADEWIGLDEMGAAGAMLERLASTLCAPLSDWM